MDKITTIVFDIGNVILNFDHKEVAKKFTNVEEEQNFLCDNVVNSPEWAKYGMIDTGYVSREEAILMVQDRTNHINDELINVFWMGYLKYSDIDTRVMELIYKIKEKGYKIYLLSNINEPTYEHIKEQSDLFDVVDGYVLSYLEHQVKPYDSIYQTLISRYKLIPNECMFIDDRQSNVDTSIKFGMKGMKVNSDDYESVLETLSEILK